jgi:hypothetical protein
MPSVHAQMPCCASQTIASRDTTNRQQSATTSASTLGSPQTSAPVALVLRTYTSVVPSIVPATLAMASRARFEPTPPLFLLNAQFLI